MTDSLEEVCICLLSQGIGGNREDWWYLKRDTGTNDFYVEHEWNHLDFNQNIDSGTQRCGIHSLRQLHPDIFELAQIEVGRWQHDESL